MQNCMQACACRMWFWWYPCEMREHLGDEPPSEVEGGAGIVE